MIGIYNTIALDGQDTGKNTTVSGTKVLVNATAKTRITSFVVSGIESTQSTTPSFDQYAAITGATTVYYRRAATESATGTQYSGNIGSTLYGGMFDLVTGKTVITHDRMQITSSLSWSVTGTAGSNRRFYASLTGLDAAGVRSGCFCTYATYSYNSSANGTFYLYNGRIYVGDNDSRFATTADFKNWLDSLSSSYPFYIVYPLANIRYTNGYKTNINKSVGPNYYTSNNRNVTVTSVEPYIVLKRPNDFTVGHDDIYAGEYTTGNGSIRADRVGWKYSDTTLEFDELTTDEVNTLSGMHGAIKFYFDDNDGPHEETVIIQSFGNTATRFTLPDGSTVWKNIQISLRFVNAYD